MLRFIGYLDLLESKIDDLEQQNPTVPIRQYATHDKSPTKKFLPWLVKQHKLGNVTLDHPDLAGTLVNFDKYKSKHGINDHTQHSFQEVADAVRPHIGTAATNKELQNQQNNTGVEVLHKEPNGITAQHIKTKEASQNMYGGGDRGGEKGGARGTPWCVSARSKDCRFQHPDYGEMYTIHDPSDDRAPYAVHPGKDNGTGSITSRFNDGEIPIKDVLKEKPHLTDAIGKIQQHFLKGVSPENRARIKFRHGLNNFNEEEIGAVLSSSDHKIRLAAIKHPNATADHITHVLTHENNKTDEGGDIRTAALYHKNCNTEHITHVLTHENSTTDPIGDIRSIAMSHTKSTIEHANHVLSHETDDSDPFNIIRDAAKEKLGKLTS